MNRTQQKYLSETEGLWGITKMQKKFGIPAKELKRDLQEIEAYQIEFLHLFVWWQFR